MKKYLLFVTLVLTVGAIAGWTISRSRDPGISQAQAPEQSEEVTPVDEAFEAESTNLRLNLDRLLREHTVMGAMTLTALYEGADTRQLMVLMTDNQDRLTELIQNTYGQEVANSFLTLWAQHLTEYGNYTLANKDNRTADMSSAKQNLETIAGDLGRLFDDNGDNLDGETVTNLMLEHINGMLAIIDAVDIQDPTIAANLIKVGYDQVGLLADSLSRGIILDNPNIF